jgi:hypothetical protein
MTRENTDNFKNRDQKNNQVPKFKLKSVAKKEKNSERNRLKQNLRDYVTGGLNDDDFDDDEMMK